MKDLKSILKDENSGFVQTIYDIFGNALWNSEIWHPTAEEVRLEKDGTVSIDTY